MNDLRFAFRTQLRNPSFTIARDHSISPRHRRGHRDFQRSRPSPPPPLPYPEADRLVSVWTRRPAPGNDGFVYFVASWDHIDGSRDNKVLASSSAIGRISARASYSLARARQASAPLA
jgi:hypothetical protein